jgi:hypothetical protein
MRVAVALVVAAAALGAGFVVMRGATGGSGDDDVRVTHATLQPGRIVLTLQSHADHVVAIAQAIVNDSYANFEAGTPGPADIAVDYPWIEGESYEIELLTSTGASVDFEIDDASSQRALDRVRRQDAKQGADLMMPDDPVAHLTARHD